MFWILCSTVITLLLSLLAINRYFSFKLHKNLFPLTLTMVSLNMFVLLVTDILLPWDLKTGNNSSSATNLLWLLIYWTQFIICWLIIPVQISYLSLKYITLKTDIKQRLSKAIMDNVKFYSLCLAGILIGFTYLIFSTGHSPLDFKPLLISLSHLYSLSYTLILLSSGLIMFPRDLLKPLIHSLKRTQSINDSTTIERDPNVNNALFIELSKTNEDLNDAQLSLSERAATIQSTQELSNGDIVFNELLIEVKDEIKYKLSLINDSLTTDQNLLPLQTSSINSLEKLNNNYNKFITNYYNFIYYKKKSDGIIHILAQSYNSTILSPKNIISIICGFIAMILSCLILMVEILPRTRLNDHLFWQNNDDVFISTLLILSYNTVCSLYAMSKFKFNNFHLIANGNSNPSNVLYYSLYSSRLLFPLCFNLMTLLPKEVANESSFNTTLYHDLKLISFVNFLNNYLPMCFMILVPISYKFDIKRKILLKILGEEYYYQFFGMMIYEPVANEENNYNDENDRQTYDRINEDYEYSLRDGRYIYEQMAANVNFDNNSSLAPISLHDNVSTTSHLSTSTHNNNNISNTVK
ncbi:similar to hypothetical protein KAFR_0C04640 [Kazachstania africana CBS 2517] [Maudiozyma barnettii]|uniref:Uncharacterized protein n=1 Tax=Maudiozyma barnettii TaxID=61262 RepID=A0A8H2VH80_9SACH|nr:similar to hypothetical protein KAFR_0C04640 [Kazachstania africana CBS 2517] [Kazachstania barnettii]CAB4255421.1 similar to hypothetical protein KAFR_0C04640 [Kazachstania africana CBS 2517] [Kazachstania barnettii]CAD1783845.1 similar to hypothetical protein KAFR_0C04640 [Kazachstania africana CBS 2517] [Kazachstania barnettii]